MRSHNVYKFPSLRLNSSMHICWCMTSAGLLDLFIEGQFVLTNAQEFNTMKILSFRHVKSAFSHRPATKDVKDLV